MDPRRRVFAAAVPVAAAVALAACTDGARPAPRPAPAGQRSGTPGAAASPVAAVAGPFGEVDTSGAYVREEACPSSSVRAEVMRVVRSTDPSWGLTDTMTVRLRNVADRRCTLRGWVGLTGLRADGSELPIVQQLTGDLAGAPLVTLEPGAHDALYTFAELDVAWAVQEECRKITWVPARLRFTVPANATYGTFDAAGRDGNRPAVCDTAWRTSVVREGVL